MPNAGECSVCGAELVPRYDTEPFTMNTPIGTRLRSWLRAWACTGCGLLFDPAVLGLPDPRKVEHATALKREQDARAESIRQSMEQAFGGGAG